jgi:hypothetical protein
MSNSFYNHGAFPSTGSAATSASMRAELDLVAAGFDKMPTLAGNANKFIVVNSTGTGLTQTDVLPAFTVTDTDFTVQDDGDNTRKFKFNAGSITTGNTRTYVMPDLDTTLVGTTVTQTLTNKTLTAPVIATIVNTGTLTLPTSTDTLVGRNTTDTLTNKTLTNPVIGTIVNTGTLTLPTATDTLVGRQTTDTLTNKTISGASNTLSNIANGSLSNSSIVIGSTTLSLGGTMTTLAGVTISGASNTLSNIANASLTNSSITINGSTVALGSSVTVTATATNALTIGNGLSGTSYNGSSAVTIAINTGVTADLSTAQTFSNKTISGSANTLTNIANASLTNSAITIGSTAISLGATSLTLAGLTSASATTLISTGNQATSVAISAIGHSSGTVTVTTGTAHGLTTGDVASIDGVADYTFCGVYTVTVTNANVFTYSQTASGASSSGGFSTKLTGTWGLYAGGTGPSLANGPVMINASSQMPALRVTQGGSGYALIVEDAANPDTSAFIISNAGDLAINTNKFTVAAASGNTVIGGTTSFGGNIVSNLLFTDATYDIGATGANRPRDLFLSRNLVVGGTLTLAGGVNLNGNVTIGDASSDTLTINSTITSNLIFTDNTYDIGASGATRPRNLFLSNTLTVSGTTESTSESTGTVVTGGGVGIAKSLFVGGNATVTKNTSTSFLRLQSLAPYSFPGDFTIQAGGQSTPGMSIVDNTAAQERLTIVTGLTVFNEAGADQDFRIESDTEANMFFLDAGNNRIGFKTNTPVSYLTVGGAYDQFLTFVDQRTNPTGTYDSYMAWQSFGTTPLLLGFTQNDYSSTNRRFFIKYANDNVPTYYERMGIGFYETVFNENSIDVDFRVESDGNTHMLFVDAANNAVGVGTSATTAWSGYSPLVVGPNFSMGSTGAGATFSQLVHAGAYDGANWNQLYTDVTVARIEFVGSTSGSNQNFYTATNVTAGTATTQVRNLTLYPTVTVFNEDSRDIDFRVESDTNVNALFVDAGLSRIGVNTGAPTAMVQIGFDGNTQTAAVQNQFLSIGGNYSTASSASFQYQAMGFIATTFSDTDIFTQTTGEVAKNFYIGQVTDNAYFNNNRLSIVQGGKQRLTFEGYNAPALVVNEDSTDFDFRVESDTNTHMLFVDAGNNRVGIANASPTQALDVTGNILASASVIATGDLYVGGTATTSQPPTFDRAVFLQSTTNNGIVGYSMYINEGTNNRRGSMFLNDNTGVWGWDCTASSGVPIYKFYRTGNEYFGIGDEVVVNESSIDLDFRVESDTSTHGLFMDAGQASVSVNTSSTAAFFNVQGSATRIVSQELGNAADQGTAQFNRIVKLCPSVSSNNKLIIPFASQGSLNSNTVCRVMGHSAAYNLSTPYGFEITFAVGHLNAMYSLSYWGVGGNAVSAALNGQTVEITFTTAYNVSYGVSGGVFVTLEYMTNVLGYSIDVGNVRLN